MAAVRADLGLLAAQRDTDSCCWQVLRIRLRSTLLEGASLLSNPGVQPGARRAGEARPNGQKQLETTTTVYKGNSGISQFYNQNFKAFRADTS